MTKIMLPEALPGILTGVILGAGRVFGEAAALIYTSGQSAPTVDYSNWNPFSATSFLNPTRPAETLAVHIWKLNTEGWFPMPTQSPVGFGRTDHRHLIVQPGRSLLRQPYLQKDVGS